ncbi:hypothetical protein LWI28_003523 [Acer negundo]|uniref:Uncharacterized protein n=1 Tax=Acer negundo TaxID=4023 RepID=A0AAD5JI93_ACENE|nr:hypothetical protein LWI28_003523 [Acer negundo]
MAKAAQLVGKDQAQEDSPRDDAYPVEEEEEDVTGTRVPKVEADKSGLAAEGEENASVGSMVPVIEENQPDTTAEVIREGAASQGKNLKEEENA